MSNPETPSLELFAWQQESWQRLAAALANNRIPHALMFTGPPGIGKRHLADILGAALLCQQRNQQQLPCGECRSCRHYTGGTHPDFASLKVAEDKKWILIDQVRAFTNTLYLRPQYAGARVGRVEPAESLFANAANALLKTLEEPPAGSHILLISEQPSAVIATIRSRCQIMQIPRPGRDQIDPWLQQQPPAVAQALDLARGAPLRAQALAQADMTALQGEWLEQLLALAAGRMDAVTLAGRWSQQPLIELFDWLYLTFTDLLKTAFGVPSQALTNRRHEQSLVRLSQLFQTDRLRQTLPRLIQARRLLDSNADTQLILEQLAIGLSACRRPRSRIQQTSGGSSVS